MLLVIGAHDAPVAQQRGGIVDPGAVSRRITDDEVDAARALGEPPQRALDLIVKARAKEQILRRITGHREFRKNGAMGPGAVARVFRRPQDPPGVAVRVPDGEVVLSQHEAQRGSTHENAPSVTRRNGRPGRTNPDRRPGGRSGAGGTAGPDGPQKGMSSSKSAAAAVASSRRGAEPMPWPPAASPPPRLSSICISFAMISVV